MSPSEIVNELNKYIIGQDKAKRAVAIALRNRYRRSQLPKELRDEITPKNIIKSLPKVFTSTLANVHGIDVSPIIANENVFDDLSPVIYMNDEFTKKHNI